MLNAQRYWQWQFSSAAIAILVFLPLATLFWLAITDTNEQAIWSHLRDTVLADYITSSLILMLGVALITLLLGISTAWLVTQYSFAGRGLLNWALLLPLAMPTYITAYSYTGLLDVAGPLQTQLRTLFGLNYGDYWFPEIRSLSGAIFVMGFVLYPYVYLLARASFLEQSPHLRDAGQLFGLSRRQAFIKINLPIARPAIVAGVSLVLMETLADYGAVSYFGVSTFTTGIFRTWYGLDSVQGAAQLALVLLAFIIVLIALEKQSRQRAQYHAKQSRQRPATKKLSGIKQIIAISLCATPILIGFIIPVTQLLFWAVQTIDQLIDPDFWLLVINTVSLAAITALLALAFSLVMAYSHRISQSPFARLSKQLVGLGYAIPGTVIAVGTLIPLARLDNHIDAWFRTNFDVSIGLLISGTVGALIIAYLVRFLAIALNTVDSGLSGIGQNMDQAARSLGLKPFTVMRRIHLPILRTSLLTALLIVFVDVMKELPATLILRPFNFSTLAVRAYELASDERLADAALASVAIVIAGLIPVILLTKALSKQFEQTERALKETV